MTTNARKSTFVPSSAMVLAAGLGLRMRPLTATRPKPLVAVGGRPLIDYILAPLFEAGITSVVVNVHHLAQQMRDYAAERKDPAIIISDEERELLDSGGGIKHALDALGTQPFFVLNADSFWIDGPRPNLERMAERWDPAKMDVLLLLASNAHATGYDGAGDFMMAADGRLTRRGERIVAPFVYAGVAILKPDLFAETPEGPFSLNLIFDRAIADGRLFGLRLDGEWLHVGTPEAIVAAEAQIARSVL